MVTPSRSAMDRLEAIARDAGRAAMVHYDAGAALAVSRKADQSPVTAADRAAHDAIAAALATWDPSIPVISEEGTIAPYETRRAWPRFWLVDPLDGTKEFISHNGEFTVNVALVAGGVPVLGVVFAPAIDVCWVAAEGEGAWRREAGGAAVRVHSTKPAPGQPLVVAESRSHPSAELEAYLATIPVARRVRAGSSIKLCWVADGRADVYPRLGPTMEWDVAAGDCVFRNSGRGAPRRSPLTYNTPELRNAGFVLGLD